MSEIDALPVGEYAFPGPLRDSLVAAILSGEKTSTTSLVVDYESNGEELPRVGDREAVVDSDGRRVCVTENTDVVVCRLGEVTPTHARAEGEGFDTVAEWRAGHERFWHSSEFRAAVGDAGFTVDDDTVAVCVSFKVVTRA
jgi:uncharacterized protein YhfF